MTGAKKGYSVVAYIPWMWKTGTGSADADQVFGTDGLVKTVGNDNGPQVGLEFQLNAQSQATGQTRDAILTWNGIGGQSYQQCGNYGLVKLITGDLTARGITRGAKNPLNFPTVSTQPVSAEYTWAGAPAAMPTITALSVAGAAANSGAITYQWYSAATETGPGAEIATATAATYTPAPTDYGRYYYYCQVIETVSGRTVATFSNRANIHIAPPRVTLDLSTIRLLSNASLSTNTAPYATSTVLYNTTVFATTANSGYMIIGLPTDFDVTQFTHFSIVVRSRTGDTWDDSALANIAAGQASCLWFNKDASDTDVAGPLVTTTNATQVASMQNIAIPAAVLGATDGLKSLAFRDTLAATRWIVVESIIFYNVP
jgi:hypothetical protein